MKLTNLSQLLTSNITRIPTVINDRSSSFYPPSTSSYSSQDAAAYVVPVVSMDFRTRKNQSYLLCITIPQPGSIEPPRIFRIEYICHIFQNILMHISSPDTVTPRTNNPSLIGIHTVIQLLRVPFLRMVNGLGNLNRLHTEPRRLETSLSLDPGPFQLDQRP
jgi:hypothetical protein